MDNQDNNICNKEDVQKSLALTKVKVYGAGDKIQNSPIQQVVGGSKSVVPS